MQFTTNNLTINNNNNNIKLILQKPHTCLPDRWSPKSSPEAIVEMENLIKLIRILVTTRVTGTSSRLPTHKNTPPYFVAPQSLHTHTHTDTHTHGHTHTHTRSHRWTYPWTIFEYVYQVWKIDDSRDDVDNDMNNSN